MTNNLNDMLADKFVGKVVATRGVGSGVNVGRCAAVQGANILLEGGSFFMRSWSYDSAKSYGAFHSLSTAQVSPEKSEITKVGFETVITDLAQCVVCDEKILKILEKIAKG